jgi:hypothetical protein
MSPLGLLAAALVQTLDLPPAPGPLDNPLKGWAAYADGWENYRLPASMAYFYVPWKDLEPERGRYDFDALERRWNHPHARGKHVIFRLYLDYPGKPPGVPDWIPASGVQMRRYTDHDGGLSPNYQDPKLLAPLLELIAALGKRYDRNPRVAFVAIGTLGFWGEWHTWPRNELFPDAAVQRQVVQAYRKAFPNKLLVARYPRGETARADVGYHDDYFPEHTLEGSPDPSRSMPLLKASRLTEGWRTHPRGAEMVPRQGRTYMGERWDLTRRAVEEYRLSWMGPGGPILEDLEPEMLRRAEWMVRRMGYEFRWNRLSLGQDGAIELEGENQGVAPFYYRWPVRLAWLDARRNVVGEQPVDVDIRTWVPGPIRLVAKASRPAAARYLALGIIDPWRDRPAIGFANPLPVHEGWILLARFGADGQLSLPEN